MYIWKHFYINKFHLNEPFLQKSENVAKWYILSKPIKREWNLGWDRLMLLCFRKSKKSHLEMIKAKYLDCVKTLKLTNTGTIWRKLIREWHSTQGLAAVPLLLPQHFDFIFSCPLWFFYSQDYDIVKPFSPSLQTLQYTPLWFLSKSWPLFFTNCF